LSKPYACKKGASAGSAKVAVESDFPIEKAARGLPNHLLKRFPLGQLRAAVVAYMQGLTETPQGCLKSREAVVA
jgi:hypothetical protein